MSFSVEFYAENAAHARGIIEENKQLPAGIKTFLSAALDGIGGNAVHLRASGHLHDSSRYTDYNVSNATIEVRPILMSIPKGSEMKST